MLLSNQDQELIAQNAARKDRANDGLEPVELLETIQTMHPALSKKQVRDHYHRTLKKRQSHLIKPSFCVCQATTTRRNAISVKQQWRWHQLINNELDFLRKNNTGVCKCGCGKTFGELIDHFVIGGDETCFMATKNGAVKVIAAKGKKKHEKRTADCRDSITAYRSFNFAGTDGPTGILTKGQRVRHGYTDKFLRKSGIAEGSTVILNTNAFIDTETWEN